MKAAERPKALLVAFVLALPAGTVVAANDQPVDFAAVDKDASGRLTKQEVMGVADLEAAFDKLDLDHDATLTPEEFSRWGRSGKARLAPRDPATVPGGSAGSQHMPPSR